MEEKRVEEIEIEDLPEEVKPVKSRAWLHILLIVLVATLLGILGYRVYKWNKGIEDDTDVSIINHDYDVECMDYILPADPHALEGREDDGVTTVVCLGNSPFSDDYGKEDNLANLIEKELGENAKVYNCSMDGSIMACAKESLGLEYAYDAFSLYWLSTVIALENDEAINGIADACAPSEQIKESLALLESIDFDKVDVIAIMYDATEFYWNMRIIDPDNDTNIRYITGALAASIQLIQEYLPHVRIMVMSPTFAYMVNEDGSYDDPDKFVNTYGSLATYAIKIGDTAYENSVSYIDNYYGSVNALNADQYLADNIHLNVEGRKLIAKRFVDCLRKYE